MEAMKFVKNKDYVALGKALHPIMDAYSPPHEGFSVFNGGLGYYRVHFSELIIFVNTAELNNSIIATELVYSQLNNLPADATYIDINNVFYRWLAGYLKYLEK